jgi:hypothetical protein
MGRKRNQLSVALLFIAACGGCDAADKTPSRQLERVDIYTAGGQEMVCAALFLRMAEDRKYGFDRQENLILADIFLQRAGKRADKAKALELARSGVRFGSNHDQVCRREADRSAALRADVSLRLEHLERRAAIAGDSASAL